MTRPSLPFCAMSLAAFMMYVPQAQAYIDPGLAYGLIQAAFAIVFGGAVAWVLRPWTYVKGLFRGKHVESEAATDGRQGQRREDQG